MIRTIRYRMDRAKNAIVLGRERNNEAVGRHGEATLAAGKLGRTSPLIMATTGVSDQHPMTLRDTRCHILEAPGGSPSIQSAGIVRSSGSSPNGVLVVGRFLASLALLWSLT